MSEPISPAKRRGLYIGRVFGIELYLDYSWFLIATILTYTLGWKFFPEWLPGLGARTYMIMGALGAGLFFLSIILHELGHSLVSQRCGIPVPRITLLFIGGLAEIAREPDDAKSELKIALGGPLVSVGLIVLFGTASSLFTHGGLHAAGAVCEWLATTNFALVIFNMIPGYPLDGGRVLRALLWARTGKLRQATFITSRIGIGFSWVLVILGVYLIVGLHQWNGLVFLLIAIFLKGAAESGYTNAIQREVLAGKRVREIMTPQPVSIPSTLPLNLVVDEFFLTNHHVAFPVTNDDGVFRGLLRLEMLREVPRERWPYITAGDFVAENQTDTLSVGADTPAARAMRRLLTPGSGRLAVTLDSKIVGMITRHDILHFIEIHTELEA
ncbi:site-2 protease family protein [Verrucomicrobiota bacterium sgz303538]